MVRYNYESKTIFRNEKTMYNLNHYIYIPFLNFYEDKVDFAFVSSDEDGGSITTDINKAFYSSDIARAKKIFRSKLNICSKYLWKHWGLIKLTKQQYIDFKPILKKDIWNFNY